MNRLFPLSLMLSAGLLALPAPASATHKPGHTHDGSEMANPDGSVPAVEPNRLIVDVHGVVCSICAFGLEKRLSKLPGLDRSQFKNGVQTDIKKHHVTLALEPGAVPDFRAVHDSIKDGGYTAVAMYFRVSGPLTRENGRTLVTDAATGRTFELGGTVPAGDSLDAAVKLNTKTLGSAPEDRPLAVEVVG